MRSTWTLALICTAPAICGCSSGASLSGKVIYQGRLVTFGSLIFLNDDGAARETVIQPDGSYSIAGLKRGVIRIGILSPDPAHARSILRVDENRNKSLSAKGKVAEGKSATPSDWFPVPPEYGDPQKSGLTVELTQSHQSYDITIGRPP